MQLEVLHLIQKLLSITKEEKMEEKMEEKAKRRERKTISGKSIPPLLLMKKIH